MSIYMYVHLVSFSFIPVRIYSILYSLNNFQISFKLKAVFAKYVKFHLEVVASPYVLQLPPPKLKGNNNLLYKSKKRE